MRSSESVIISSQSNVVNVNKGNTNNGFGMNGDNKSQEFNQDILKLLQLQIEFYFSATNLPNDMFLLAQMNEEKYVPLSVISTFSKVKEKTSDMETIIKACENSGCLELSPDKKSIRPAMFIKRSIMCIYGFKPDLTQVNVHKILNETLRTASKSGNQENDDIKDTPIEIMISQIVINHADGLWYVYFDSDLSCSKAMKIFQASKLENLQFYIYPEFYIKLTPYQQSYLQPHQYSYQWISGLYYPVVYEQIQYPYMNTSFNYRMNYKSNNRQNRGHDNRRKDKNNRKYSKRGKFNKRGGYHNKSYRGGRSNSGRSSHSNSKKTQKSKAVSIGPEHFPALGSSTNSEITIPKEAPTITGKKFVVVVQDNKKNAKEADKIVKKTDVGTVDIGGTKNESDETNRKNHKRSLLVRRRSKSVDIQEKKGISIDVKKKSKRKRGSFEKKSKQGLAANGNRRRSSASPGLLSYADIAKRNELKANQKQGRVKSSRKNASAKKKSF